MLNFIDDIGQKRICTVSNSWLGNQRHFVKRYRICKMISKIYQRLSAYMYVKLIYLWLQYTMIIATKAIRKQPNPILSCTLLSCSFSSCALLSFSKNRIDILKEKINEFANLYILTNEHYHWSFSFKISTRFFGKVYSTQRCLLAILEKWKAAIDRGEPLGAFLTDLSKAFDWLSHQFLLAKLHAYGFSISALRMIHSYLTNRKQRTKIHFIYSSWEEILFRLSARIHFGTLTV